MVLTGSQIGAMLVSTVAALVAWVIAARMTLPAEVGKASAIVALGTLVSGLVAAGLGQYLLAALPEQQPAVRRRSVLRTVTAALIATAVAASIAGWGVLGDPVQTALVVLTAVSVTAANTQDSVYLCAGAAKDIASKAVTISLLKPPLVMIASSGIMKGSLESYALLVLALLLPSISLGLWWQIVRAPRALDRIPDPTAGDHARHRSLLGVGYLYALSSSLVNWGMPALATNLLMPSVSALFYVAWMIASAPASMAAAVANVVVSRSRRSGETLKATPILLAQGGFSLFVAVGTLLLAPLVLGMFGTYYQGATPILAVLLIGQTFASTGAVLIAFARRTITGRKVAVAIAIWAIGGFGLPGLVAWSGAIELPTAYALGSGAAFCLVVIVLRQRVPSRVNEAPCYTA